jgi:ACS family allantoate permease-like MFS transporter
MWWKRNEQPWRTAVIFSTLSSVINGLLSYACSFVTEGGPVKIDPWRLLFILCGIITFVWSGFLYLFLPDSPTTARWLDDREKVIAVRRCKDNHTGMENKSRSGLSLM